MRQSLSRLRFSKHSSFTLVELLVVIGIIAILAGVLRAAGTSAIRAAQRARANNMAIQIQTAVLGYYTEYSVYPIPGGGTGADVFYGSTYTNDWENLTYCLCGNVNAASPTTTVTPTATNSRGVPFLSLRSSDIDSNGVPVNPIYPTGAGAYFNIAMDGNYDGLLGNSNSVPITNYSIPTMPATVITQGVAVWADCNTGTGTNNNFHPHTY